jgi:hypothetical protein
MSTTIISIHDTGERPIGKQLYDLLESRSGDIIIFDTSVSVRRRERHCRIAEPFKVRFIYELEEVLSLMNAMNYDYEVITLCQ